MQTLDALQVASKFQVIITADDVRVGKPDPECYTLALRSLQVDPANSLVIEDSPNGIRVAKQAGCKVLALTTTHDKSELQIADSVAPCLTVELVHQILYPQQ